MLGDYFAVRQNPLFEQLRKTTPSKYNLFLITNRLIEHCYFGLFLLLDYFKKKHIISTKILLLIIVHRIKNVLIIIIVFFCLKLNYFYSFIDSKIHYC